MKLLKGRKSYITGVAWVLWGAWSYFVEEDRASGVQRMMEGLGLITLRAGVSKGVERAETA